MPTDKDRASASIRFEGEARRLTIRLPRLDRDGLFLFGRRYAAQTVTLTLDEVDRLHSGRVIAVDVAGQYLIYIRLDPLVRARDETLAHHAGAQEGCSCTPSVIPQRERSDRIPSDLLRAVAARVRVNADRRAGVSTPRWVIDLANSEHTAHGPGDTGPAEPLGTRRRLQRLWRKWRSITVRTRDQGSTGRGGLDD
jgi:hypothetical protein